MTAIIPQVFALGLLAMGASHLLHPSLWAEMFASLGRSRYGSLVIATFTLPAALLIVLTHNVWRASPEVIVTLFGWGMLVKSLAYLLVPASGARLIQRGTRGPRSYVIAGAVMIVLGLVLTYDTFLAG